MLAAVFLILLLELAQAQSKPWLPTDAHHPKQPGKFFCYVLPQHGR